MSAYSDLILARTGLVSYWRLGEPSGSFADSKASNTGTASGTLTRAQTSLLPGDTSDASLSFGGGVVNISDHASLDLADTFSIEAWINGSDFTTARAILSKGNNAYYLRVRSNAGNNKLTALKSFSAEVAIGSTTLNAGTLYHVVWTKSGATNKLYVNGVDDLATVTNATCADNANSLQIGQDRSTEPFAGLIDEVALYSTAISPADVLTDYTLGINGPATATTNAASSVTDTAATLNSTVNPKGLASNYSFEYGLTTSYGSSTTPASAGSGTANVAESTGITGLSPSTTYHFRAVITNASGTFYGSDANFTTTSGPAVTPPYYFDRPNPRLAVAITSATGQVFRLGRDEPLFQNVPGNLSFSSSIPGGFRDCTIRVARDIALPWDDLGLFNDVTAYGPGNEIAWQGRIQQLPRESGEEGTITLGCVGWGAHLRDDPSFIEVYVDSDLSHWGEAPLERVLDRASTNVPYGTDYEVKIGRSIHFSEITDKSIQNNSTVEAWYLAPAGVTLAFADYYGSETIGANNAAASIRTVSNLDGSTGVTDNTITLDSTLRAKTLTTERYAYVRLSSSATHTPTTARSRTFRKLAVFGNHGLTLYAPEDANDPRGVYASDVIADVLSRAAPLLNTKIDATSFSIPQLAFLEPTTAEDVIAQVNAYHLWEWGVYDNRCFFFRAPDPSRLCWEVRLADGAQVELEGDAGDEVFNGVLVRYTNPNGIEKTAGPIGSGADAEDESLQDTDPSNPVSAHGIPRRWGELPLSVVTTQAGAIQLGAVWLSQQQLPQRRGQLVLQGTVRHPTAGRRPVWAVRAGDYVKLTDHSADVARRIIDVSYDHASQTATCSLENASHNLDAILQRVAALTGAT